VSRKYHFQVRSPLGQKIRVTKSYWIYISEKKHPEVKNQEQRAVATIKNPDIIKQSSKDLKIFLYYRKINGKYFCIVARHLNGKGFVITAYISKRFVGGKIIWRKPKN